MCKTVDLNKVYNLVILFFIVVGEKFLKNMF